MEDSKSMVSIGMVVSPRGVKGEVKVYPLTDFPERCRELNEVLIRQDGAMFAPRKVENARIHGKHWLVKFAGVNTPEEALLLKGAELCIPANERISLPPGSYYIDEIIGLDVFSPEGKHYGTIIDVILSGGQDIYKVKNQEMGNTFLLPAVKDFVREVDIEGRRIVVDIPLGLLDI